MAAKKERTIVLVQLYDVTSIVIAIASIMEIANIVAIAMVAIVSQRSQIPLSHPQLQPVLLFVMILLFRNRHTLVRSSPAHDASDKAKDKDRDNRQRSVLARVRCAPPHH
jgi:hypothetical protein